MIVYYFFLWSERVTSLAQVSGYFCALDPVSDWGIKDASTTLSN